MAKILIVFSSIGGNTELVVDKVKDVLGDSHQIKKQRVDTAQVDEIKDFDLTILACPTYGQGTLEAHFLPFLKNLKKSGLATSKRFSVIGLGDNRYYPEYLTEASAILEEEVQKMEGELVGKPLRIGTNPVKFLDSLVAKWAEKLKTELN